MIELPKITDTQEWCCERGCGPCRAMETNFEVFRSETLDGELLESRTEKTWVSHCCGMGLMLWDRDLEDFVETALPDTKQEDSDGV